jgi:hypothetical protein
MGCAAGGASAGDIASSTGARHMSYGAPMYGSPNAGGYQQTPPQSSYVPLAPVEEASPVHQLAYQEGLGNRGIRWM